MRPATWTAWPNRCARRSASWTSAPTTTRPPATSKITVNAKNTDDAWAYAHHAVANAKYFGVTGVKIADRQWQTQDFNLPEWTETNPALPDHRVEITLR